MLEYATIKNDTSPRAVMPSVPVQAKEAKTIVGIIEVGAGFVFTKSASVILDAKSKKLSYNVEIPQSVLSSRLFETT